jgi:2-deoxy-D-gluconate 3-dehydrogenase
MKDLFNLHGKVAIVTGGNGGIGKSIARGLASVGANIVIAARNEVKTTESVREIHEEFDTQVIGVEVDLRQEKRIHNLVTKTLKTFERIDILVNNAGINIRKFPQDYTAAEWD